MIPVVMSGGSGTRLWPVSRAQYPKQFCKIFGESLQELTIKRLLPFGNPLILTGEKLKVLTESQIHSLSLGSRVKALYEPAAKNTAPAIAFLVRELELSGKLEEIVGIFPSDHLIQDEVAFEKAIRTACAAAETGKIVTLGIRPTEANTGYGYIQTDSSKMAQALPVLKFHEKPNSETAEGFLKAGGFFWNAGIFIFRASVMRAALLKHAPQVWECAATILRDKSNLSEVYRNFPSISIDYAVMEKMSRTELSCVPADIGWSDVGSWDAVAELMGTEKSDQRVVVEGHDNFAHSYNSQKLISFVGLDGVIAIDTEDALLLVKKSQSQLVKDVVARLEKQKPELVTHHGFEFRPWGKFEVLRDEGDFKSKVITVNPGQRLSLQSHAKREEHWIVVSGSGIVVLDSKEIPVKKGSYVHIPLGAKHRIFNPSTEALRFVEVQLGDYFGEDDIVRYQDDYSRL